jgi:hypothetical protein
VHEPLGITRPCPGSRLLAYFLRLGTFNIGGPIALAGRIDRNLGELRWILRQYQLSTGLSKPSWPCTLALNRSAT